MQFKTKTRLIPLLTIAFAIVVILCGCVGWNDNSSNESILHKGIPAEEYKKDAIPAEVYDEKSGDNGLEGSQIDELKVRFIDVGQGDSILLTCGGQSMLVDGGKASASSKIYSILQDLKISKLDYMVATHPDADHVGGLSGALEYANVENFLSPTLESDTKTWSNLIVRLDNKKVNKIVPSAGDIFKIGTASAVILGPVTQGIDENNNSLVIKITNGEDSFLLTGDAEYNEESSIIYSRKDISSEVLKVGHHGSSHSTSDQFLDAVNPKYAIISVGKNSYGHPTDEVVNKLKSRGIAVFRTDEKGHIVAISSGNGIVFNFYKNKLAE